MADRGSIPGDRYAIIIGAAKAGTTTLYRYLSEHPEVAPCREKEPEYFTSNRTSPVEVTHYEELWDYDSTRHRVCLEGSTGYSRHPTEPEVPEKMAAYGLRPWFIYVVRDPISRIRSHLNFHRSTGWGTPRGDPLDPELLQTSSYAAQLDRYRAVYGSQLRMRLIDFHALVEDPVETVTGIQEWLGLATLPPTRRFHANPTPEETRGLRQLRTGRVGRLASAVLPVPVKSRIRQAARTWGGGGQRELAESEVLRIRQTLAGDVTRLEQEYGFPTHRWGF